MEENIKVIGRMVNNTEKVNFIIQKMVIGERVYGAMGKELNGKQYRVKLL